MSYQIYNDSATLKIVENGATRNLAKAVCGVRDFGDYIIISYDGNDNYLKVLYTDVTVPAAASATALRNTLNGYLTQTFAATIDTSLIATSANQTNGNQKTKITDGAGVVNTKQLGTQLTSSDVGLVTNTIMHGQTTGGGGGYVDVKVTPSGALTVEINDGGGSITVDGTVAATQSGTWNVNNVSGTVSLPTGAATSAAQTTTNNHLETLNSLVPTKFDYISLSYTLGNVTTVVYKLGGSGGSTVSTLTLAYDGSGNLTSVTKT